jgi:LmbE family N-acetylglucosaminyl deacetylase
MAAAELHGRVAVVSPHLDDAVLSLGSAIAAASRSRAIVRVVTVFAGDASSSLAPGEWDARSGFGSAGEAAVARADEDDEACTIVGAEPIRLPFPDEQYGGERDAVAIRAAIEEALEGADTVLLPGFPLTHPDHAWVSQLFADDVEAERLGLYVEQPYAIWAHQHPDGDGRTWTTLATTRRDQLKKLRACRAYRSQIAPIGGLRVILAVLAHEALHGGESIAWVV